MADNVHKGAPMSLKMIIFDLDGTLLDTLHDLADATNEALAQYDLPPLPDEEYKHLVGMGARVLLQRSLDRSQVLACQAGQPIHALPAVDCLVEEFNQAYEVRWANKTQPYAGITELLKWLSETETVLAILSNKSDAFTRKMAERYFPDGLFRMVYGMRPDFPGKPDPSLTLELCRQAGVLPQETALIGDSGSDMKTAVAAGVIPIGVLWGFRSAEELTANGALYRTKTPAGLTLLLKRLMQ
jgi:phosphoglycolate phosphatase